MDEADGATLKVGPGETYTAIQPAIDNATSGDIVAIANGTYNEDLNISKSLEIIGSSMDDTIVNGTGAGSVITIMSSNVNISGLSVRNSGSGQDVAGISVIDGDNCTLRRLDCSHLNGSGISVTSGSENTTISECVCSSNAFDGITISDSVDITVRNSTCSNNTVDGIDVETSTNVTVRANWCWHNGWSGISLSGKDVDCVVEENSCQYSVYSGVAVWQDCGSCQVLRNNCSHRTTGGTEGSYIAGIWVNQLNSGLVVEGNTIFDHFRGIAIYSNWTTVNNNTCGYNKGSGIVVGDGHTYQWYNKVTNNTVHHNVNRGIHVQCSWTTVANNTLYSNNYGIFCARHSHNSTLENNICYDNSYGIYISDLDPWTHVIFDLTIRNNTIGPDNGAGLVSHDLGNCFIVDNNCSNNTGVGITVSGIGVVISRNTCIDEGSAGISITGHGFTLVGNNASSCTIGLSFRGSYSFAPGSRSTLRNNDFNDNTQYGIYFHTWTEGGVLVGNHVCGNTRHGIYITEGRGIVIANNTVRDNHDGGLYFIYLRNSMVENNIIGNSTATGGVLYYLGSGLTFGDSLNITIAGNVVTRCSYGIILGGNSAGCLIYNNWFGDNTDNWFDPNGISDNSTWNVTKTPGVNVCGYNFLGGNYWDDYGGVDTDADGIGNTQLPYGPGDKLPLVRDTILPRVDDLTVGQPTTGDPFILTANVTDNLKLTGVWIEYWYNGLNHTNVTLSVDVNDSVMYTIHVPSNMTGSLYYRFIAVDSSINWNITSNQSLVVLDNDLPEAWYNETTTTATTGEDFRFVVRATDNVAMSTVWVEYWYGTGSPSYQLLDNNGSDRWNASMTVNDTLEDLHFRFTVTDNATNWIKSPILNATISDNDAPEVVDMSSATPTTGDPFTIIVNVKDNIGIDEVNVIYWFGASFPTNNISMVPLNVTTSGNGTYIHNVTMPSNSTKNIHYYFAVNDTSDNWNTTSEAGIDVVDNDRPWFISDDSDTIATTGDYFHAEANVSDNIGILRVQLVWWKGNEPTPGLNYTMLGSDLSGRGNGSYSFDLFMTHDGRGPLHYRFAIRDLNLNWNITGNVTVNILDNDPPELYAEVSPARTTTGDVRRFQISAYDNWNLTEVRCIYWFGTGPSTNGSMVLDNPTTGNNGAYILDAQMPDGPLEVLSYRFYAVDVSGNWNLTHIYTSPLVDNDDPVILDDLSDPTATTGDTFHLRVNVSDNIGITGVYVLHWFEGIIIPSNTTMVETTTAGIYEYLGVTIPIDSTTSLNYRFVAIDASGNWVITDTVAVTVLDDDPPEVVEDLSDTTATTGEVFHARIRVRDNIGIDLVNSGKSMWTPTDVDELGNGIYEQELRMDDGDVGPFYLSVRVLDLAGNELTYLVVTPEVVDNDPPELRNDHTPDEAMKGGTLGFGIDVWENVAYQNVSVNVEYRFDQGPVENASMIRVRVGNEIMCSFDVDIPRNAEVVSYRFTVGDTAGNWNVSAERQVTLYNAPPSVAGIPTWNVTEGTDAELDLVPYITDPNDDVFTMECSDDAVTVEGLVLRVRHDVAVPDRTVTITVSDGEDGTGANLTIHVVNVNDLPVITGVLPANGTEYRKGRTIVFTVNATDEDGDDLTIKWKDGDEVLATGSPFEYTKLGKGEHIITVVVDDGTGVTEERFVVTVKEDEGSPGPGLVTTLAAVVLTGLVLAWRRGGTCVTPRQ